MRHCYRVLCTIGISNPMTGTYRTGCHPTGENQPINSNAESLCHSCIILNPQLKREKSPPRSLSRNRRDYRVNRGNF